jgi:hypothetical protein
MKHIQSLITLIFAALLATLSSGCKSSYFVGVQGVGNGRFVGVVSASSTKPVEGFIQDWLIKWEHKNFSGCYANLSDEVQKQLSVEQLGKISSDLDLRYGKAEQTTVLEMPITHAYPNLDEASFRDGLQYYDYVLGRYLNRRDKNNLVYFFGVAKQDGQLRIVTFGISEEALTPTEAPKDIYWFGYPSF